MAGPSTLHVSKLGSTIHCQLFSLVKPRISKIKEREKFPSKFPKMHLTIGETKISARFTESAHETPLYKFTQYSRRHPFILQSHSQNLGFSVTLSRSGFDLFFEVKRSLNLYRFEIIFTSNCTCTYR